MIEETPQGGGHQDSLTNIQYDCKHRSTQSRIEEEWRVPGTTSTTCVAFSIYEEIRLGFGKSVKYAIGPERRLSFPNPRALCNTK
jgi:hypothetical protein